MYNITANSLTLHDKVSPRLMKLLCLYSGFGRVGCSTTMVWVWILTSWMFRRLHDNVWIFWILWSQYLYMTDAVYKYCYFFLKKSWTLWLWFFFTKLMWAFAITWRSSYTSIAIIKFKRSKCFNTAKYQPTELQNDYI